MVIGDFFFQIIHQSSYLLIFAGERPVTQSMSDCEFN
jgi:hypothetical protein